MGALFSRRRGPWVPEHRKLDDLLDDEQRSVPTGPRAGRAPACGLGAAPQARSCLLARPPAIVYADQGQGFARSGGRPAST